MTRLEVLRLVKKMGWKPWGKMRPYKNGSRYQCFRRGIEYAWVGNYFVEVSTNPMAMDFVTGSFKVVRRFLSKYAAEIIRNEERRKQRLSVQRVGT